MPIKPNGFVEISGLQGDGYSLDMCLDYQLTENEFRLIYNSDPDGEYSEDKEKELQDNYKIQKNISLFLVLLCITLRDSVLHFPSK